MKVSGNAETSEIDILQLLGLDGTTSLVALDIDAARQQDRRTALGRRASTVRKVYPSTIEVTLKERQAFAIWQHGSDLSLIEKNGSGDRAAARQQVSQLCRCSSAATPKWLRLRLRRRVFQLAGDQARA